MCYFKYPCFQKQGKFAGREEWPGRTLSKTPQRFKDIGQLAVFDKKFVAFSGQDKYVVWLCQVV
jgi:hypothetical protein